MNLSLAIQLLLLGICSVFASERSHNKVGNQLYRKGQYEEALQKYTQGETLGKKPNAILQYNKGNALYQLKNPDEAIEAYKSARESSTKPDPDLIYNLGNAYYKKAEANLNSPALQKEDQSIDQAIDSYLEALRLNPKDTDAKHNLDLSYKLKKRLEEKQKKETQSEQDQNGSDKNKQDQKADSSQKQAQSKDQKENSSNQNEPEQKDAQNKSSDEKQKAPDKDQNQTDQSEQNKNATKQISKEEAERLLQDLHQKEKMHRQQLNMKQMEGKPYGAKDW